MPHILPYSLVSKILGVFLLAAAALKLQGLAVDPVGRMGVFSTSEFQLGVVELEVFLALWLISGIRPLTSWNLTLATFICFGSASLYLGWIGQSSCGCFGRLSVSPWYAFGIDVVVLVALVVARPEPSPFLGKPRSTIRDALFPAAYGLGGMVVMAGLLLAVASYGFGSVAAAIAYFRGERISVEPRVVDVGESQPGEVRQVIVAVKNWADSPIKLVGGTKDCSCTVLNDLPVTIPPNEARSVAVSIRMPRAPGIFTRKASFLVDDQGFKRANFVMTGRITGSRTGGP
jgi:hypothetical protein